MDKRIRIEQLRKLGEACEEQLRNIADIDCRLEDMIEIINEQRMEQSIGEELFGLWKATDEKFIRLEAVVDALKTQAGWMRVLYTCPFCKCWWEEEGWSYEIGKRKGQRCSRCGLELLGNPTEEEIAEALRKVDEELRKSPFYV